MGRKAKSCLPAPIPGEPFSLIGTLRRCTSLITPEDCAQLLGCHINTVYDDIHRGSIPEVLGLSVKRVDPKRWAELLEHENPHLLPILRKQMKRAA